MDLEFEINEMKIEIDNQVTLIMGFTYEYGATNNKDVYKEILKQFKVYGKLSVQLAKLKSEKSIIKIKENNTRKILTEKIK